VEEEIMDSRQQRMCVRKAVASSLVVALLGLATLSQAEDNTSVIISGTTSNHVGSVFYVGNTGTNNSLTINSAGELFNRSSGYIGYALGADGNRALVTDNDSLWFNFELAVGWGGSLTRLPLLAGCFNVSG
jgi:hypothetical protein